MNITKACAAALALLPFAAGSLCHAQMVTGSGMVDYDQTLGLGGGKAARGYSASLVESSIPGNVMWPGEQPKFTFQVVNTTGQAIDARGRVEVIGYGTRGRPGDVWTPTMFKIADAASVPVSVHIAPNGFMDLVVAPKIPARFGGYALVLDLGPMGRQFLTSCVRTFKADPRKVQYPHFCLDDLPLPVLTRLGTHAIRWGVGYKPTTDKDFESWYAERGKELKAYHDAGVTVLFMAGGGEFYGDMQPLGRPRPWLDDQGVMQDTKFDLAWKPSYDPDFQKFCNRFARDYGWPKGPVTAFSLWNEPWEGISISGWGADVLRYREIYTHMFQGVAAARQSDGVQVLVGGGDSSSNAMDKFFTDGKNTFDPMFDFLSIHYQGLSPTSNLKHWIDHKGYNGRVKIWDTESWVANVDDRVAAVVAGDRAAGYDRAMGVYGGNIVETKSTNRRLADGGVKPVTTVSAWSTAAAVGAATHFIGERTYRTLLFHNGLPWVMVFDGVNGNAEDGTVVVVGDLGEEFGEDNLPPQFAGARGYAELRRKAALKKQLAALSADASPATRLALQTQLDTRDTLTGAQMTLPDGGGKYGLYDFYGNPVPSKDGRIVIPLDGRGYFLRSGGARGGFASLVSALQTARLDGMEPIAVVAHDMTAPVESHPAVRLSMTNVLNRPVAGRLSVTLGGLNVAFPKTLRFGPNQTLTVPVKVGGGAPNPANAYPMSVTFDAGKDGVSTHQEVMRVNFIPRKTIAVDGDLTDWSGVLPQTIAASGASTPTMMEQAWLPFKAFNSGAKNGLANAYLAYDAKYFYFAAKIADSTPDPGMVRFAKRDDDAYFYPATSYAKNTSSGSIFSARWTGQIQPKYSETYTFSTVSDDGVRLWIDGKPVVDNWTDHGPTEDAGTVTLEAGRKYDIKMEYFNSGGGGTAQLFWRSNSEPRQIVPSDCLFDAGGHAGGLTAQYSMGTALADVKAARVDPVINFTWADKEYPDPVFTSSPMQTLTWPDGIRRYSYRKDPDLPAGNAPNHDNVQIAFNVLDPDQKRYNPTVPGAMPGFVSYDDTDYEYALNPVAEQYGGGVEIWRLQVPGMPRKHFYPRQPASPFDGPVTDGKLVIKRDGDTRIVECAIPWTEMPLVKKRIDAGQTIKFSYRVNDNTDGPTMELSKHRSVAKRNGSFHEDWVEHWSNELEFGAGK
ncbi:hypothetical protein CCAX7_25360 [Capsulimonas corticalis]|uniref:Uncharacterized protein n=1 Tax=Capsulimonas corticalis TaxID=2219043 RepID=A0A402CVQ2_9BACT|nr:PA14 domain-containing protein [Capsulimonas corticalis]BDI30485.1 hypothetical protein CCAX7_25360 [Capsulimonas corticalis]